MTDRPQVFGFEKAKAEVLSKIAGGGGIVNPTTGKSLIDDSSRTILAYTAAGATARSGTTLGVGVADVKYIDNSGVIQDAAMEVEYLNVAASAVGSAKYILLSRIGNRLICIWEEC